MVVIDAEAFDAPESQEMSKKYYNELRLRLPAGFVPDENFSAHVDDFVAPDGAFLVARLDGNAVGCGGVRRFDGYSAEIKHMWVDPATRGLGVGRAIIDALIDYARSMRATRVLLDTSSELTEARALYQRAGFREIERYNDNPYAQHWYERTLD